MTHTPETSGALVDALREQAASREIVNPRFAELLREAADRINTLELEALGAGIKIDDLEREAAIARPADGWLPEGWMRDRDGVIKLADHLENVGWEQDERGDMQCIDQGAAMAAEVIRKLLLPMLAASPSPPVDGEG